MPTTQEEALQLLELARNALRSLYGPNAGSSLVMMIDDYLAASRGLERELEKTNPARGTETCSHSIGEEDIFGL